MADPTPQEIAFDQWTRAEELRQEWIKLMSEVRLKDAKTKLVLAENEKEADIDEIRDMLSDELERSLRAMRRTEQEHSKEIELLEGMAAKAVICRRTRLITARAATLMWQGWNFFLARASDNATDELYEQALPDVLRQDQPYYRTRNHENLSGPVPENKATTTMGFIAWLQNYRILPAPGSPGQRVMVKAFNKVAACHNNEIADLKSAIADARKGVYETWKIRGLLAKAMEAREV